MGFDHVMISLMRIVDKIGSKATQPRAFRVLLEKLSAEYGDLLLQTEIHWLIGGRILQRVFFFFVTLEKIKPFMESRGEETTWLQDTGWRLDLSFLTDIKNWLVLNCELQSKAKNVSEIVSVVNVFRAKMNSFVCALERQEIPALSPLYNQH